jgi:hypothetical protein
MIWEPCSTNRMHTPLPPPHPHPPTLTHPHPHTHPEQQPQPALARDRPRRPVRLRLARERRLELRPGGGGPRLEARKERKRQTTHKGLCCLLSHASSSAWRAFIIYTEADGRTDGRTDGELYIFLDMQRRLPRSHYCHRAAQHLQTHDPGLRLLLALSLPSPSL